MTLQDLLDWPPEIGELAGATRDAAANHFTSAEFYRALTTASTWQGDGGEAASAAMLKAAVGHDTVADTLGKGVAGMEQAQKDAETLAQQVKDLLDYAAQSPTVEIDMTTNQVITPDTSYFDEEAAAEVDAKVRDLQSRVTAALAEGELVDDALGRAIDAAAGTPTAFHPTTLDEMLLGPLEEGEARNLGPIAGTGAEGSIPGIGAADLGEVVQLPNGTYVAVFGDSFEGGKVGEGGHYHSVAVPVTFDENGTPHFGKPLNSTGRYNPNGGPNVLFPPPPEALDIDPNMNTLPAGTIQMNGKTYMMVSGTSALKPTAGSWLVEVNNDPSQGWKPVEGSWRPWISEPAPLADNPGNVAASPTSQPTQISGYQGSDGMVYIAADSFDRSQPVTMYRVDPDLVTDRSAWQPWTGSDWGTPGEVATAPITGQQNFGEISFREIDGRPVLSGFNASSGPGAVEIYVGSGSPTDVYNSGVPTTVMQQANPADPNFVAQNYGGYIMPGSTLDDMVIWGSQWNTMRDENGVPIGAPYNTQQVVVNPNQ